MMNIRRLIKNPSDFQTVTTKLTILSAQIEDKETGIEGFTDELINMKFQTEDGTIFSQDVDICFGVDSILHQIIDSAELPLEEGTISTESLIGKSCNAVIATKKDWKRAFIVAVF